MRKEAGAANDAAIDPVVWSYIDTKLQDSFTNGLGIAERPSLNLTNTPRDSGLRVLVAKAVKPIIERDGAQSALVLRSG